MRIFILAGFALVLNVLPASAQSPQTTTPASAPSSPPPMCVYSSAQYSDGAFICVQKSVMLTCQSDGAKATWKMVTDKDVADKCAAPNVTQQPRRVRARHRFTGSQVYSDPSAKCFNFNGKRYCE